MAATNSGGSSAYSNVEPVLTVLAPVAPTNLVAPSLTAGAALLRWNDNANNETGYVLERSLNGTSWNTVATLGANVNSYIDSGLSAVTDYFYRVHATSSDGRSLDSNTLALTTAAAAPTLAATADPTGPVDLTWAAVTGAAGYRLQRSTDGVNFQTIATPSGGATSYRDANVASQTQYHYRLAATNSGGSSAYSNVEQVLTS